MCGLLLTHHIFTLYIISVYKLSHFLLQQKRRLVWQGEHGSMQKQGEARNRKHPPWVLLQSDEQQQKQHWLSAERQKEHLTTWVHITFSCRLEAQLSGDVPLTLYVAHSTQSQSHIQLPLFTRSLICHVCFYYKKNLSTLWCDLRALWYFHMLLYLLGHHNHSCYFINRAPYFCLEIKGRSHRFSILSHNLWP